MKKMIIFLCSMIIMIGCFQTCFADEYRNVEFGGKIADELKGDKVGELTWTPVVELWHYSGGYWKSNWFTQQYKDAEMSKFFTDIQKITNEKDSASLDTKGVTIEFTSEYDDATKDYISKNGLDSLGVEVDEIVKGIFYYNKDNKNDPLNPQIKLTDKGVLFKATPRFYIDGNDKFRNYVGGLSNQIPIPAQGYGLNVYSMYSKSTNLKYGRAEGCFEPDPSRIEYSDILDINGSINPDKYLYIVDSDGLSGYLKGSNSSGSFPSSNMKIGQGTFANAGAVGIFYQYPIQFEFFAKKPSKTTSLIIKYWDKENNKELCTPKIMTASEVQEGEETEALSYHILDWDGYTFNGWQLVTPDGDILETGDKYSYDVSAALDYITPNKVLNVELIPIKVTPTSGELKINIINSLTGAVIYDSSMFSSELPNRKEIKNSFIKNTIESNNCVYDESSCTITDFEGRNIEKKNVEYMPGSTLKLDNILTVSGNLYIILTEEEPNILVTYYAVPKSGAADIKADCSNGSITWRENHSHTVSWINSTGKTLTENCTHKFEYEVHLTDIISSISPETLKSGYSFSLELKYGMSDVSVSDKGGSSSHCDGGVNTAPEETVKIANKAIFAFPDETYTVNVGRKHTYTQPYTFELEATEAGDTAMKLEPPVSEISTSGKREIFTPVTIAGTAESPAEHHAVIQIRGGGVSGVEFCYNVPVTFIINGNMYEDGNTM